MIPMPWNGCVMSWAPQATTESGQWVGNGLRFATREEAEAYVVGLALGRNTRVVESITAGRMGGSFVIRISPPDPISPVVPVTPIGQGEWR